MPTARLGAAVLTVLLAASGAASAAAPRGLTFTDPAGDANFADGANGAGSQASLDVLKVRITPYARTAHTAGITVRIDLAGPVSVTPGSSYFVSAKEAGCDITAARTAGADGVVDSMLVNCGDGSGRQSSAMLGTARLTGKSVTFDVPAEALPDGRIGAKLTDVQAGTSIADPAIGTTSPVHVDTARATVAYALGS